MYFLRGFSVWSSIFDFFWCWEDQDALSRPLFCFSLNNCKKKKKKKKRFVPRPCFFPASRKTTPSSVAGCLVKFAFQAARSFAVIELPSDYPQWSAVDEETGKFHGSHFHRRASRLRQEAEAKRVQCLCDQAEATWSCSCVTWLANPGRKTWTDNNVFLCSLVC